MSPVGNGAFRADVSERGGLRVVVCGTRFGQVYLSALRRASERFRLVGVVARGSARSKALAEEYGVPLYGTPAEVPEHVDVAVVVVSSGVGGGPGTDLARAFLERGIHVVQEHPVHPKELADCLRVARRHGVQYLLNTFYPHLEPVRRFRDAARRLVRLRRPVFVDAMCAIQVSFDLLDLLGQIFDGLRPWSLSPPAKVEDRPLTSVDGTVGGVPLSLRVENRMEADDDSSSLFLHRITIGTDAGNLSLVNTHGPVLWSPVLRTVTDHDGRMFPQPQPSAEPLGPPGGEDWRDVWEEVWTDGIQRMLGELEERVASADDPLRAGQHQLSVAYAWQELTEQLGFPEPSAPNPGAPLTVHDLLH